VGAQPSLERSKGRGLTTQTIFDLIQGLCMFVETIDDSFGGSDQVVLHVG
jgi:hypothetical protein